MSTVDLLFPVIGTRLPTDHAYPLYSAISHLLPKLHSGEVPFALAPATGEYAGDGQLFLDPRRSHVRLRMGSEHIPAALPLAGKHVRVLGHRLRFGVPQVHALRAASDLYSPAVTIKHAIDEAGFASRARQKLDELGVRGTMELARHPCGARQGEARRSVIRIKDDRVICFGLFVRGLSDEESLRLQAAGIGGRRHVGAGMFFPATKEGDQ
jgi:CRISPR-associated endonuclease/helicase Cas3